MPNPTQPMNEEELLLKVRRKAQFFHRGCPANDVIDGDADLEKCTCGVDDQLKDVVKLIIEDRNAVIREARIDELSMHRRADAPEYKPEYTSGISMSHSEVEKRLAELQSQPNAKEEE